MDIEQVIDMPKPVAEDIVLTAAVSIKECVLLKDYYLRERKDDYPRLRHTDSLKAFRNKTNGTNKLRKNKPRGSRGSLC